MYTYTSSMIGIQVNHTDNPLMKQFVKVTKQLEFTEIEDWYDMSSDEFAEFLEDMENEISFKNDEEEKFCIKMLHLLKDHEELSYTSAYNGAGDTPLILQHNSFTDEYKKHCNENDVFVYHISSAQLEKQLEVVKKMEKFINDLPYDEHFKNTLLECSGIVYNQMSS